MSESSPLSLSAGLRHAATRPVPAAAQTWAAVGGRPVRVLVRGAGPDLVVVPGLGALGYLAPTLRRCARWARVHLLDVPGFGHPATARCPSSLDAVAATVAAWLRAVPSGPVVLAGHSTGAQAALLAALAAPGRVEALLLGGPTFPPEARTAPGLAAAVLRTAVHEDPREACGVAPEYGRGRRRVLTLLRTALADRPEDAVPAVEVPVTVVRGRHDRISPHRWGARLAGLALDGRLVTVRGAHNSVWTHPDDTAAAWRTALPRRHRG